MLTLSPQNLKETYQCVWKQKQGRGLFFHWQILKSEPQASIWRIVATGSWVVYIFYHDWHKRIPTYCSTILKTLKEGSLISKPTKGSFLLLKLYSAPLFARDKTKDNVLSLCPDREVEHVAAGWVNYLKNIGWQCSLIDNCSSQFHSLSFWVAQHNDLAAASHLEWRTVSCLLISRGDHWMICGTLKRYIRKTYYYYLYYYCY